MSTNRNRVNERAEEIYAYLKENLNTLYKIQDLMAATKLKDTATTRSAIREARSLAEQDGLCLPVACPANGHTYCVTDDPTAVIDPAFHLGAIGQGVGVRKDVHDDFIKSRMSQLPAVDRGIVHAMQKLDSAQRAQRDAYGEVLKTVIAVRRAGRKGESE